MQHAKIGARWQQTDKRIHEQENTNSYSEY